MDPRRVVQRDTCPPTAQHVGPDKNSHRPAVPGNRDFLTAVDARQQLRKLSPCLRNGDRCHDRNCTSLYIEVQRRGADGASGQQSLALEERDDELAAARAANRELMAQLNATARRW